MPESTAEQPVISLPTNNPEKERKFPCKSCGAELLFAPGQSVLECPYCKHVEKIPQTAEEIKEYSFNDYLAKPRSHGYGQVPGHRHDIRCGGCGVTVQFDDTVRASKCPFCGAVLLIDDQALAAAGEDIITPEGLVPFVVTAAQADASFRKWINSLWFAPSALKATAQERQLQGVYRPFWTYDARTVSHWTGERGDAYYVTEHYTTVENGKTVSKTRQVRKIRWTWVSGVYSEFFDDVLINAGNNTDKPTTYRLSGVKHYSPEYLSGFAAERYVVSCEDGWVSAKKVISDEIYSAVRRQIGGDEQRVHSVNTAYSGVTYKHILLPLWISSYRYRQKSYSFQVNGQTGECAGSRPYSFWKIFFLVLGILAAVLLIAVLAQQ
jgi:predicted RNA-binding Zn-ribbon protein involved in translation (DUF1610 family)